MEAELARARLRLALGGTTRVRMRTKLTVVIGLLVVAVAAAVWLRSGKRPLRPGYGPNENHLPTETQKILDGAERFVLLSLDPTHPALRSEGAPPPKETFHDYGVLGRTEIRSVEERTELLHALYKGIADSDGAVANCFNPRHGISATSGDETVDLVICFECLSMQTYHRQPGSRLTTRSPEPTFNRALERANLPIAKKK